MKDWPDARENENTRRRKNRWRDRDFRARDTAIVVTTGGLLFAALLAWPLYQLLTGAGSRAQNFTILGGLIGLALASYAVMTDRMEGAFRWFVGAAGLALLVLCWGFGPL